MRGLGYSVGWQFSNVFVSRARIGSFFELAERASFGASTMHAKENVAIALFCKEWLRQTGQTNRGYGEVRF